MLAVQLDPVVVCASTADWDAALWTNKQHLMSRLADRGVDVLYIDSPGLRAPSVRAAHDWKRIARRVARWRPVARPIGPHLWRDSPLLVPLHGSAGARWVNGRLQIARLRRNLVGFPGRQLVLWVFAPTAYVVAECYSQAVVIYHCVDDLAAFPRIPSAVVEAEARLVERADVCIASSQPLRERLVAAGAREVLYWPNCADTEAFASGVGERGPAHRPIAGFIGAVQEHKIDMELVIAVAVQLPEWEFQLIGPIGEGLGVSGIDQRSLPSNVLLMGSRRREELPDLVSRFDVAIIPYRINDYTRSVFPMKVFEYLAAGIPVVSTPLPSLVGEILHVAFASRASDWAAALEVANRSRRDELACEVRRKYAGQHSWTNRTSEALELLGRWCPLVSGVDR